jgi:hypothetical protein
MSQDDKNDKELGKLSYKPETKKEAGENDMAVTEKELKEMQKLRQKKMTREQLRKALIKETIKENYKALYRLSRT